MGSRLHSTDKEELTERIDKEFQVVSVVDTFPEHSGSQTQLWIWDSRTEEEISEALSELISEVYKLQNQ